MLTSVLLFLCSVCFASEELLDKVAPELQIKEWVNLPKHKAPCYRLNALRGKVVVVVFWRVASEASEKALPDIESLHKEFKDKGLVVIGISRDRRDEVGRMVRKLKLTFPTALDDSSITSRRLYKVKFVPRAFVINPEGVVVWEGSANKHFDSLKAKVEEVLDEVFRFVRKIEGFRPERAVCDALSRAVDAILDGDFRKALSFCNRFLKRKNITESERKDALYLVEKIREYAKCVLRSAKVMEKTGEFVAALALLKDAVYQFADLEEGKEAKEMKERYRREKRLKRELQADALYQEYLALKEAEKEKAAEARLLLLKQRYPETVAGKKAALLLAEEEKEQEKKK